MPYIKCQKNTLNKYAIQSGIKLQNKYNYLCNSGNHKNPTRIFDNLYQQILVSIVYSLNLFGLMDTLQSNKKWQNDIFNAIRRSWQDFEARFRATLYLVCARILSRAPYTELKRSKQVIHTKAKGIIDYKNHVHYYYCSSYKT